MSVVMSLSIIQLIADYGSSTTGGYGTSVLSRWSLQKLLRLKVGRRTPDSCPSTWRALSGAFNSLVVFQKLLRFNPHLNFLKFHLNSVEPLPYPPPSPLKGTTNTPILFFESPYGIQDFSREG